MWNDTVWLSVSVRVSVKRRVCKLRVHRSSGGATPYDLAERCTALAPPCLLLRFICFLLTVKQSAALAVCVFRATTQKVANFLGKKAHPLSWPGLRIFLTWKWPGFFTALAFGDLPHDLKWPGNYLAALTSWRRHCTVHSCMRSYCHFSAYNCAHSQRLQSSGQLLSRRRPHLNR